MYRSPSGQRFVKRREGEQLMPQRSIVDCQRFCEAIVTARGRVPEPLERLLSIAELLMAPGAVSDPLKPVLDAAMQGQLDQRKLDKMLADAATQTQIDSYKQDLRPHAERAIVQRFHKALRDGAADTYSIQHARRLHRACAGHRPHAGGHQS